MFSLNRVCVSVNVRDQLTKTEHEWEHLQERSRWPTPLSSWHHWYGSQLNPVQRHSSFASLISNVLQVRPSVLFGSGSGPDSPLPDNSSSTLSSPRMSVLLDLSKREVGHPPKKRHYRRLYLGSCPFSHHPQVMSVGEGWNVDWLVNRKPRLPTQLSLHHNSICSTADAASIRLAISNPFLTSLGAITPLWRGPIKHS